jgi:predicted  nucleic acid-binding Zn-ribbon protein
MNDIRCYDNYYNTQKCNIEFMNELSDLLNIIKKENSIYKDLYAQIEQTKQENETLREKNKIQIEEIEKLKQEKKLLQDKVNRDYVANYSMLRRGVAFGFKPILSKEFNN